MMPRADMRHIRTCFEEFIRQNALLIHPREADLRTVHPVNFRSLFVSGVLQTIDLVPADQLQDEPIQILCSGTHHNLIRIR